MRKLKLGLNLTKKPINYFTLNRLISIFSSLYQIISNETFNEISVNFMADVK